MLERLKYNKCFLDVNECNIGANNCNYECKNLIGTYVCVCPEGYRKVGLRDECLDIDECSQSSGICLNGQCLNTEGGYQCNCDDGYQLSPDGKQCLDIRRGTCHKRVAGGRCEGGAGGGLVTKTDCCCTMGSAWGDTCELCPPRGTNAFAQLCSDAGFGAGGKDIDECKTLPDLCENGMCVNTLGSYRCICDRGYKPDVTRTQCVDFNECQRVSVNFFD